MSRSAASERPDEGETLGPSLESPSVLIVRWTRTQRIRTAAEVPVDAVIVDRAEVPVYVQIGEKAMHLRDVGVSGKAIARALGVSDKTVAKAIERAQNT